MRLCVFGELVVYRGWSERENRESSHPDDRVRFLHLIWLTPSHFRALFHPIQPPVKINSLIQEHVDKHAYDTISSGFFWRLCGSWVFNKQLLQRCWLALKYIFIRTTWIQFSKNSAPLCAKRNWLRVQYGSINVSNSINYYFLHRFFVYMDIYINVYNNLHM